MTINIAGFLIHDVARLMRKRFEQQARAKSLGLTRSQAAVISRLARHEGINQVTLAQLLDLEPITVVRLLDRLQAAGLIERRTDPLDRRVRLLHLTPAARPLLARIYELGAEVREEAFTDLSTTERDRFLHILETMKMNMLDRLADDPVEQAVGSKEAVNG